MNWKEYSRTCGYEIEMRERREAAAAKQWWDSWRKKTFAMERDHINRTVSGVLTVLPEGREAIWQAILCRMTVAMLDNKRWDQSRKSCGGMFVRPINYYPWRALAYDITSQSTICSAKELERAMYWRKPLYPDAGLLWPDRCGSFWKQLFDVMPPYSEADILRVEQDSSVTRQAASGEAYRQIDAARWGVFNLFMVESLSAGADMKQIVDYLNLRLSWFEQNWKRLCGTDTATSCSTPPHTP